jgi:hypothetical protein
MKAVRVRRKSFVHLLATSAGFDSYDPQDLCTFSVYVVFGVFWMHIRIGLGVVLIYPSIDSLLWIAAGRPHGSPGLFVVLLAQLLFFTVIFVISLVRHFLNSESTVVGRMYDSWKDKYCVPLEVEG